MSAIDYGARARRLGVNIDDLREAEERLLDNEAALPAGETTPYGEYPDVMGEAGLRAYIRWFGLDRRLPGLFDENGYIGP